MSDTKFTIDISQALAQLDGVEKAVSQLEARFSKLPSTIKAGFRSNLTGTFDRELGQAQKSIEGVKKELEGVAAKTTAAFNANQAKQYAQAVAGAEQASGSLKKASENALKLNSAAGAGTQIFRGLLGVAAGVGAAFSFSEAIKAGVSLNAEYERIKTSLTVLLKDSAKADNLLSKLNQFAADTPFETGQINQAATALLAFGESETTLIDKLRQIGTVSAATGKDFNELVTIYGKARVAGVLYGEDVNQLVEAGVPIIGEFAKQLGVSQSQVKKLASDGKIGFNQLEIAFQNLTKEGGQFGGLLEKQSQTLGGRLSTLADNAKQFLRVFTDASGITRIVSGITDGLSNLFGTLTNKLNPTIRGTSAAFDQQAARVSNLEKNLVPLLDRYAVLSAKTSPTKKEQAELATVIQRIGEITPGAITEIDKYGNVLSINAGKSREFLEAERARLKFVNAETVKSVQAQKDAADAEIKIIQERIKAGKQVVTTTGVGAGGAFGAGSTLPQAQEVKLSAQEIQDLTNKVKQLSETSKGAEAEINRLLGKNIPETPAPVQPKTPTAGTGTGKKQKSALELEFERREKDLAKQRLLLNDLQDGLDKELAEIKLHFDQLRLEYEKAGLDISKINEQQQSAEVSAVSNFIFKQVEADAAAVEASKKAAAAFVDDQKKQLEAQRDVRDQEIELRAERGKQLVLLAKKAGADEKQVAELQRQFDLATQAARLESELKFQEGLLAIVGAGNEEQRKQIEATIANIKAQLGTLKIDASLSPDTGGKGGKKQSLWDVLGIDTSTEAGAEFAKQAEEMAGRVIASIQEMSAARVAAAEADVQASNDRLKAAQDSLDQEIKLAELGFASNVTLKRKQLEEEKKKNAATKAELEKAKKSQLAIDTAIQASSLITSIANLFKSLSGLPFGAGIPIAIALSAAMIGFFIKSKIDAAKAVKARHGISGFLDSDGIVSGRYHDQGGEHLEVERGEMVQVGDDGRRRRVEVVRRERVGEYMDLLRAANKGDRRALAIQAMKLAGSEGLDIGAAFTAGPRIRRGKITERVFGSGQATVSVSVAGGDSKRTNELLERLIHVTIQGHKAGETWSPDGKVKQRGNVRTKYVN